MMMLPTSKWPGADDLEGRNNNVEEPVEGGNKVVPGWVQDDETGGAVVGGLADIIAVLLAGDRKDTVVEEPGELSPRKFAGQGGGGMTVDVNDIHALVVFGIHGLQPVILRLGNRDAWTGLSGGTAAAPGNLTINSMLTFAPRSTYKWVLNRTTLTAGKITALGVSINNATLTFAPIGSGTVAHGTSFTVIDNISANPIIGTFANLPDGEILTSGGITVQANYHGGTGNDLTLTVQ
jgi:hypothetical protein